MSRLVLNEPQYFDVGDTNEFKSLRRLILGTLLGQDVESIPLEKLAARLPRSPVDLRSDLKVMLQVEQLLLNLLKRLPHPTYQAIQFPANVRMLKSTIQGRVPAARSGYSTERLHCDAWSGAPSDSFNHLLYLYTEPGCPYLEMYPVLADDDPLRFYVGDYGENSAPLSERPALEIPCASGVFVIWPTYSPHRTVIPTQDLEHSSRPVSEPMRISVDVRARLGSPYTEDRNFEMQSFADTKMNSAGVYWTLPTSSASMSSKTEHEMRMAALTGPQALAARKIYVSRYYPDVPVS